MWCVLAFFLLFSDIFGTNEVFVQGSDPESGKPSLFKQKLAQDNYAELLTKKLKPVSTREGFSETQSQPPNTDYGIVLPPEYANDTIEEDHHTYYNSTFYTTPKEGKLYWIDVDEIPQEKVITHAMLSDSHRQATTIELSFDFPFYGTVIRNITIATGGFLYMGEHLHNWIAATQYVAPLMANFDTSMSENSTIKYADNGTAFIVEWDNVYVQEKLDDGAFTFQVTLFKTGDILFAYKEIPYSILNISDVKHPVKVGISDAYIMERTIFFVRRKTIYEYHRIDMVKKSVSNNTAIYFTALTTCLDFKDCDSCLAANKKLECLWCESVKRCSDGIDRHRQSWVVNGCSVRNDKTCPVPQKAPSDSAKNMSTEIIEISTHYVTPQAAQPKVETTPSERTTVSNDSNDVIENENTAPFVQDEVKANLDHPISIGAIITILVFVAILIGVSLWMFYAYKFPQSTAGQFLIKYRPSQWNFKTPENNQNSDSFHM